MEVSIQWSFRRRDIWPTLPVYCSNKGSESEVEGLQLVVGVGGQVIRWAGAAVGAPNAQVSELRWLSTKAF